MIDTLLTEAYYGKNPVLLECEKLVELALTNPNKRTKYIKQVQVKLQELFHFKTLIISPLAVLGGSTIPISTYKIKFMSKKLELEKNNEGGLCFKREDNVEALIWIDLNAAVKFKLTGEEVVGILLHEVGHSMRTILPSSKLESVLVGIASIVTIIPAFIFNFVSTPLLKINDAIDRFIPDAIKNIHSALTLATIKYLFPIQKISTIVERVREVVNKKDIKELYPNVISSINIPKYITKLILLPSQYRNEQLSDIVSTSYGYGPALISAFSKYRKGMDFAITDNFLIRLYSLPYNMINMALDPHPENVSRMKMIIDKLETDLKANIDSDAYAMIEEDLNKSKIALEEYRKSIGDHKFRNIDIVIFHKVMEKLLKGHSDLRALFLGITPNDLKDIEGLEKLPVTVPNIDNVSITECSDIYTDLMKYPKETRDEIINMIIH